nr:MAG TPA: hypothetical protein [Caudoviricetes sp.]
MKKNTIMLTWTEDALYVKQINICLIYIYY